MQLQTASERRRLKLIALCDEHDLAVVADRAGLSAAALTQIIKGTLLPTKRDGTRSPRALGDDAARRIEAAFGLPRGWFDGPSSTIEGTRELGVAQLVSLTESNDPPHLLWEDIVHAPALLPERFALTLPDDAMAPRAPAGSVARFVRASEAKQGDGVLVRDADGHVFFRRLKFRTPGHWLAVPGNDAFAVLDSIGDRLEIVAVLTGIDARWSDAY